MGRKGGGDREKVSSTKREEELGRDEEKSEYGNIVHRFTCVVTFAIITQHHGLKEGKTHKSLSSAENRTRAACSHVGSQQQAGVVDGAWACVCEDAGESER